MRPTVSEQLQRTRLTIERRIEPAISDPFAADLLKRISADLRKLDDCWDRAVPFMRWDVTELCRLLVSIGAAAPDGCADGLDSLDAGQLGEVQQRLRAELSEALPSVYRERAGESSGFDQVLDYFSARAARDPMSTRRPARLTNPA